MQPGKLSLPVNVLVAVLGTALTIDIAWPRGDAAWYERWSGWVFVGATLILAALYYLLGGRRVREAIDAEPMIAGL